MTSFYPQSSGEENPQDIQKIKLRKVISSPTPVNNWKDIIRFNGIGYLEQLVHDVQNGWFDQSPPELYELEEVYITAGLGRRVAVAKMLGIEEVPAHVFPLNIVKVKSYNQEERTILLERQKFGFWDGYEEKTPSDCTGLWRVEVYYPWAFAEDKSKAFRIYTSVANK